MSFIADRKPVTTYAELKELNQEEITEGYIDASNGEPEPNNNRSKSYWHGYRNGWHDITGTYNLCAIALIKDIKKHNNGKIL